jgi:hypothetical protein
MLLLWRLPHNRMAIVVVVQALTLIDAVSLRSHRSCLRLPLLLLLLLLLLLVLLPAALPRVLMQRSSSRSWTGGSVMPPLVWTRR